MAIPSYGDRMNKLEEKVDNIAELLKTYKKTSSLLKKIHLFIKANKKYARLSIDLMLILITILSYFS